MNVLMTPGARQQAELIRHLPSIVNGFLFGDVIGKQIIITHLFPVNFDEHTLDDAYRRVYETCGAKLAGAFFNGSEPITRQWLQEDVILLFHPSRPEPEIYVYTYKQKLIPINNFPETETTGGEGEPAPNPAKVNDSFD